ncbi:enolase C-terminal domain-like protein [Micromonospora endophytica]|uniref:Dipeptide epimerase n=1 Tax=Micromonospora endophytica TaxID=515350 RepID=A0A2W2DB53_9ACTN|nr:enolase C-terminal domain-like protein [Micromonospora endophytica]PZG01179.1 dipeptide epimerase [Micromonospora endophytica]RIW42144.1 dipeptide epimerase [Micromonospora endophytica]BCJ61848.1 dipeptide epimerase [Micromonospora endophytica]
MRLGWRTYPLRLHEPLRISRSAMSGRDAVQVDLSHDGVTGHGEVVTSGYYGLDLAAILGLLAGLRHRVRGYGEPEALLAELPALAAELPAGVLAALDAAVHDLLGRRAGMPVYRWLGRPAFSPAPTAHTIGLVAPDHAAATARALARRGFRLIKVKCGDLADAARIAAVRAAMPHARLVIDPNGAWTPEQTVRLLDAVRPHGIDAVEQPIAPGTPRLLAWISARTDVPVIADEDAATVAHLDPLAGAVAGINIKIAKCGGIHAAQQIAAAASTYGMELMLGCLVASSLGIAPAVHLTGGARWLDLDGHLLLADDPWTGIGGHDGVLRLTDEPGLGVRVAR